MIGTWKCLDLHQWVAVFHHVCCMINYHKLWRTMAKIWLKIRLKVKENGTKKNQIGENGGERKRNPSANPDYVCLSLSLLLFASGGLFIVAFTWCFFRHSSNTRCLEVRRREEVAVIMTFSAHLNICIISIQQNRGPLLNLWNTTVEQT